MTAEQIRRIRQIERDAAETIRKSKKAQAEIEEARQRRAVEAKARLDASRSGTQATGTDSDDAGFDIDSYIPGRATKEQTERLKVALQGLRR